MKVTSVEIWDTNTSVMPNWHPIIIRVNTDEGVSGVGEVGLAYGIGHSGAAAFVKDFAESFLLGADPMKIEKLWETMFRDSIWGQGGGPVVYAAMSAIDIACWDIRGKAMGQPVYQLLGGKTNESLRSYASQIQFGWGENIQLLSKPEEYAEAALTAVAEGYDCVKVDPICIGLDGQLAHSSTSGIIPKQMMKAGYERIKAIREAVGEDVDIILEMHGGPNTASAIKMGQAWEEFDCMYYEEPLHSMNVDLIEKVASRINIPVAAGERLYTRWGFRQYFEKQVLDLIQPDLCLVGGITEGKKVCDAAHTYDVTAQMHVCGSPITKAAALHLEAVIPNFQIHEHHTVALKQGNRELCIQDYQPVNGQYSIPDLPGLGIDLNDEVLAKSPCVIVKNKISSAVIAER